VLLRDVHYVHFGECRPAAVTGHWVDVADLYIYLDPAWDVVLGPDGPELPVLHPKGVVYDPKGAVGTWHLEDECPLHGNER
jgi:hypothetical protein